VAYCMAYPSKLAGAAHGSCANGGLRLENSTPTQTICELDSDAVYEYATVCGSDFRHTRIPSRIYTLVTTHLSTSVCPLSCTCTVYGDGVRVWTDQLRISAQCPVARSEATRDAYIQNAYTVLRLYILHTHSAR
jgi:hypothetical protein